MSFFLSHRNPDPNSMFSYLIELFFQNNLDVPDNMDNWSVNKLRNKIYKLESRYGPVENF